MERINAEILYVNEEDLTIDGRKKNFEDIDYFDLKDRQVMIRESVVILKMNHKYKILKSRY